MRKLKGYTIAVMNCLVLGVYAQKDCNINRVDFTPLPELSGKQFRGFAGGLYNMSNYPTDNYLNELQIMTQEVVALDSNGNKDENGKIVFIGVGASNPRTEFQAFQNQLDTYRYKNSRLLTVNTCIGGQGIQKMNLLSDNYWKQADKMMDSLGVSNLQVQVAWIETENTQSADSAFPSGPRSLVSELRTLLVTLKMKYPNLKLCYFSARAYSGFVNSSAGRGLEFPRDYYNGWAIKWLIDSARLNNPGYKFSGSNAIIPMPLFSTYMWTNGNDVRQDGFSIDCDTDIGGDGLHLSLSGEIKLGNQIFQFFANDTNTQKWFSSKLSTTEIKTAEEIIVEVYPNPSSGKVFIETDNESSFEVNVYDTQGRLLKKEYLNSEITELKLGEYSGQVVILEFRSELIVKHIKVQIL